MNNKASTKNIASSALIWDSKMLIMALVVLAALSRADLGNDASTTALSINSVHESADPNSTKVPNAEPLTDASNNSWRARLVLSKWWGILAVVLFVIMLYIRNSLASIIWQITDRDVTDEHSFNANALLKSAYKGDIDSLASLLEQGIDINITDQNGHTALMEAALGGHLASIKWLIEQGADLNVKDNKDKTAMSIALEQAQGQGCDAMLYQDCVFCLYSAGAMLY